MAVSDPSPAAAGTGGVLDGPWLRAFFFIVPVPLRSKSNHRRGHRGSAAAAEFARNREFEAELAWLGRAHRPADWDLGDATRPLADRPVVVAFIYARTLLDTANLAKSVPDAMQQVLYVNDASVRPIVCDSDREGRRERQNGLVAFAQLPPGADAPARIAAAAALATACHALLASQPGPTDPAGGAAA